MVFVLEVRKRDGSEYSPGTLHLLVAVLIHHLREAGIRIDIFSDDHFASFCSTLEEDEEEWSRKSKRPG